MTNVLGWSASRSASRPASRSQGSNKRVGNGDDRQETMHAGVANGVRRAYESVSESVAEPV